MDEPVVIVSVDTHVGPRLVEDLRPYCTPEHLDDFDRYVAARKRPVRSMPEIGRHPNQRTAGHYDHAARMADYDRDGVTAGVIFHGSQNGEPIPFSDGKLATSTPAALEFTGVGRRIYNRWLADFVSEAPERHVGLAQLPMWDPEQAVAELIRAADEGLTGVNFPVVQDGIPEYNLPEWDTFYSVCEERRLPLVTHVTAGLHSKTRYDGPGGLAVSVHENTGWLSRRAIWWLIFGGVFERHPGLKLVMTETPGTWWLPTALELESVYDLMTGNSAAFAELVPRRPTEYMTEHVFFGASGASAHEAQQAVDRGIDGNLLWGSDYPHLEGTFVYSEDPDMPSVTKLSLRNTFCAIPEEAARRMVGLNAVDVYGLDGAALAAVAARIGAPT
ncbi:MAG: amidohydrolase family protein, partial [Acidimicrobiia bacterium]